MKKKVFAIFLSLVLLCSIFPVSVTAADHGNLTWEEDSASHEITITGADGHINGPLEIPAEIEGKPVVAIGGYAFYYDPTITGLILHEGLLSIGEAALEGCYNAAGELRIPASVKTIGKLAFSQTAFASVVFQEGLMRIESSAFRGCTGSDAPVFLPASLTFIGKEAFHRFGCNAFIVDSKNPAYSSVDGLLLSKNQHTLICCPSRKSGNLTIPSTVTEIAETACSSCTELTSLRLPEHLSVLGKKAFDDCPGLTGELEIPGTLKTVPYHSFSGTKFTSLKLHEGIQTIERSAFSRSSFTGELVIPASVVSIKGGAFSSAEFTSLKFNEGLQELGDAAFNGCMNISGVIAFPASLTKIGSYAFTSGDSFEVAEGNPVYASRDGYLLSADLKTLIACPCGKSGSAAIPEGVTEIGEGAFTSRAGITSVTFPKGLAKIGSQAFADCTGMTGTVELPSSLKEIGPAAFGNCGGTGFKAEGNTSFCTVDGVLYSGDKTRMLSCLTGKTGSLDIPEEVTTIDMAACAFCSGLTGSLTLPEGLTDIGQMAFAFCSGFTGSLVLPKGLTVIEENTFENCSGLTGPLTLPEGLTTIDQNAFAGCYSLAGPLTLPSGLTLIKNAAFKGCGNLAGTLKIPDSIQEIEQWAFEDCTGFTGLDLGCGSLELNYGTFAGCSGITGTIRIPENADFYDNPFPGCGGSEFAVAPGNLKFCSDGPVLFNDDKNEIFSCLTGAAGPLEIPVKVYKVKSGAFKNCAGLTGTLKFGPDLFDCGHDMFSGSGFSAITVDPACDWFSSTEDGLLLKYGGQYLVACPAGRKTPVTLPDGIQTIGADAFCGCHGIGSSLILPASVREVSGSAFTDCSLQEITFTSEKPLSEKSSLFGYIGTAFYPDTWPEIVTVRGDRYVAWKRVGEKTDTAEIFEDMDRNQWYYLNVNWAYSHKLFGGTGKTTFEPESPMTRAMLVTVLWRLEGQPKEGKNIFTDVPEDQWFTEPIMWAAENGIVNGVGNNKFEPDGNITREQMAAILCRYAGKKAMNIYKHGDLSVFPDADEISGDWARGPMEWAVREGLIGGSSGMLLPQGNATRAQVAAILMRFVGKAATFAPIGLY